MPTAVLSCGGCCCCLRCIVCRGPDHRPSPLKRRRSCSLCAHWPDLRCCFAASSCRDQIIDRRTFMEVELEAESQSRVGKKLTELTIRKVSECCWDWKPSPKASGRLEAFFRRVGSLLPAPTAGQVVDRAGCPLSVAARCRQACVLTE